VWAVREGEFEFTIRLFQEKPFYWIGEEGKNSKLIASSAAQKLKLEKNADQRKKVSAEIKEIKENPKAVLFFFYSLLSLIFLVVLFDKLSKLLFDYQNASEEDLDKKTNFELRLIIEVLLTYERERQASKRTRDSVKLLQAQPQPNHFILECNLIKTSEDLSALLKDIQQPNLTALIQSLSNQKKTEMLAPFLNSVEGVLSQLNQVTSLRYPIISL